MTLGDIAVGLRRCSLRESADAKDRTRTCVTPASRGSPFLVRPEQSVRLNSFSQFWFRDLLGGSRPRIGQRAARAQGGAVCPAAACDGRFQLRGGDHPHPCGTVDAGACSLRRGRQGPLRFGFEPDSNARSSRMEGLAYGVVDSYTLGRVRGNAVSLDGR